MQSFVWGNQSWDIHILIINKLIIKHPKYGQNFTSMSVEGGGELDKRLLKT